MSKKQKGYSTIEVIVIVAIISLLGLVGWLVWSSDTKPKRISENPESFKSVNDSMAAKQLKTEAPEGWIIYENEELGIGFAYPESWAFEDKSEEQLSTGLHYIGELTSDDETTTIAITLVRKEDGRNIRSSIEEWKTHAANSNIQYEDLTEVKSQYVAFSYIWVLDAGVTSLVYKVLETDNNVEMMVEPAGTNQKATVEKIVNTLRFEE